LLAKKHEHENNSVLAVCDKELLGKEFEEGNLCFTVSEKFFGGDPITEKELVEAIAESGSVNLFGNKCVEIALKQGLINKTNVISISGVKHAQIYNI
jgi:uncharacterized protein